MKFNLKKYLLKFSQITIALMFILTLVGVNVKNLKAVEVKSDVGALVEFKETQIEYANELINQPNLKKESQKAREAYFDNLMTKQREEKKRLEEEARLAEIARQQEEARLAEIARQQEEARQAEIAAEAARQEKIKAAQTQAAQGQSMSVNADGSFKSYMSYKALTNTRSPQYRLQQGATTVNGFRMYDGYYMVALGSYYGSQIGAKYRITFGDGQSINCILGDQKANSDTDSTNSYMVRDGSIVEFIVDTASLSHASRSSGNIQEFKGRVVSIQRIG